jgi:hypothetical protein
MSLIPPTFYYAIAREFREVCWRIHNSLKEIHGTSSCRISIIK